MTALRVVAADEPLDPGVGRDDLAMSGKAEATEPVAEAIHYYETSPGEGPAGRVYFDIEMHPITPTEAQIAAYEALPWSERDRRAARIKEMLTEHRDIAQRSQAAEAAEKAREFTDNALAHTIADRLAAAGAPVVYTAGLGWLAWDGRRWLPTDADAVRGKVSDAARDWQSQLTAERAPTERIAKVLALQNDPRAARLVRHMQGLIRADAKDFDRQPNLLNCRNGVVDLRTGKVTPHDPALLFTKVTAVAYKPSARGKSEDWEQVKTALDGPVLTYLLDRLGQAATGHTPDDKAIFNVGSGSNGKTTMLGAVSKALGDFAGKVPAQLLMGDTSKQATPDIMTLRGLRLAFVEELPEAGRLNAQRLKDIIGEGEGGLTGRALYKDFVTFEATHSLFVNTNFTPDVRETDHGTWRRLEAIPWTRDFRAGGGIDTTLRRRVGRRSAQEAVLADLVFHAKRYYARGRAADLDDGLSPEPPQVVADATGRWKNESDDLMLFFDERTKPDPSGAVRTVDVLEQFNDWLACRGRARWSEAALRKRLHRYSIGTARKYTIPAMATNARTPQAKCVLGVKWL